MFAPRVAEENLRLYPALLYIRSEEKRAGLLFLPFAFCLSTSFFPLTLSQFATGRKIGRLALLLFYPASSAGPFPNLLSDALVDASGSLDPPSVYRPLDGRDVFALSIVRLDRRGLECGPLLRRLSLLSPR